MADLTTGNINTEAQTAASVADGDYIYIYKADAGVFSKIEKSLLLQGVSGGSGSGISEEVYTAIRNNVNALRTWCNSLHSVLANLALTGDKPAAIPEFVWPENEGGDTPSVTPTLIVKAGAVTVSNNGTVNVGMIPRASSSITKTLTFRGSNITQNISFSIAQGQGNSGTFSLSSNSVSASAVNTTMGGSIVITYSNANTVQTSVTETATLTIVSELGTMTVTLNGTKSASEVTTYSVQATLTNCKINGSSVVDASTSGEWSGTIVPDTGYTLPSDVSVTGTCTKSYNSTSGVLSLTNISSDISFTVNAEQDTILDGLEHQYGLSAGVDAGNNVCLVDQTGGFNLYTSDSISSVGNYYGNGRNNGASYGGSFLGLPNDNGDFSIRIESYIPRTKLNANNAIVADTSSQLRINCSDAQSNYSTYGSPYANGKGQFEISFGPSSYLASYSPKISVQGNGTTTQTFSGASIGTTGTPVNITIVYSSAGRTMKMYIDGVESSSLTFSVDLVTRGIVLSKSTYDTGASYNRSTETVPFFYDNIKFFNKALSASEISILES